MSVEIQELRAVVRAEIGDALDKFGQFNRGVDSMKGRFASAAGGITGMAAKITASIGIIGGAMSAAAIKFIQAGEQQRQAVARLGAVFKATGNSAGLTVKQIEQFATARQAVTNFGDEATIQGAAVLATFKSVRGEAFFQTMTAAQDLAELMGTDLQGAVLQLGKALENPTTGLVALRRSGISFTESQMETIKALVESNRLLEAQDVILKTVQGQIGGVAEAAASPLTQFQNMISDIAEDIGMALLPAFKEFTAEVGKFVGENREKIIELATTFMRLGLAVAKFAAEHPKLATMIGVLAVGKLTGISSAVGSLGSALGGAGKGLGSFVTQSVSGMSTIGKLGLAVTALKVGLVGLAMAGIAGLSVAIYKMMPSVRALNKELERAAELNAKMATAADKRNAAIIKQAQAIGDPGERQKFLQDQMDMANKNLAGLESSLAGAQKQLDDYSNGWREFTGNKVLADFQAQVDEATAALERQKGFVSDLQGEMDMIPAGGGGGGMAGDGMPVVETEDQRKAREKAEKKQAGEEKKAQEEHADDVKSAAEGVREFGVEMVSLRDKLSAFEMDKFDKATADLKTMVESGSIDIETFNIRMEELNQQMQTAATATTKLTEFGNGLNDLRDKLSPEMLDAAASAALRLRDDLESGRITMDQFDTGIASINNKLTGAAAGEDFMAEVNASSVEDDTAAAFGAGVEALRQKLFNGQITLEQFNGRLDMMREELQVATMAQDAYNEFTKENAAVPAAAAVVEQFGMKVGDLQAQFDRGEIGLDQFRKGLAMVTSESEKAAAAARRQALMKGDFAGAGLNFGKSVQERFAEQAAAIRQGQFDGAVNQMVQQMLMLNGYIDQTGQAFQGVGQQMQDFGNNVNGMAGDMKGGGEQAQKAFDSLAQFLSSREGQINVLRNQISNLQQFLALENIGYRRRAQIAAEIDALMAQIQGLLQSTPPVLDTWRADPIFNDPGLEGSSTNSGGGSPIGRGASININSIFPPSPADRRMLMDSIIEELMRRGWRI